MQVRVRETPRQTGRISLTPHCAGQRYAIVESTSTSSGFIFALAHCPVLRRTALPALAWPPTLPSQARTHLTHRMDGAQDRAVDHVPS